MAKGNRFTAEHAIAVLLFASIVMLVSVPVIGRVSSGGYLHSEDAASAAVGKMLGILTVAGITGIILSIVAGLVIAFGVGPSWMAARKEGMVVQHTFAEDSDNKYFGPNAPDLPGVRYYVRVVHQDGNVIEYMIDRQDFRRLQVGDKLTAQVLGRRIVKIE